MTKYRPRDKAAMIMRQVDTLAEFERSLIDSYGATTMMDPNGHKKFTNPWSMANGVVTYIFINKNNMQIRFNADVITRGQIMSDSMFNRIRQRQMPKPKPYNPEIEPASPVGRT